MRVLILLLSAAIAGCVERERIPSTPDAIIARPIQDSSLVVRALYAVVDYDGVYLGGSKTDAKIAASVVESLLAREGVMNVFVCATRDAKHGDFVSFYGSLKRERYFVTPLTNSERPSGYRLPLLGTFRRDSFGDLIDEATGEWLIDGPNRGG